MDYRAYVFDFDYTLVFSEKAILECFRHVFEHFGFSGSSDDEIKATIGMSLYEAISMLTGVKDPAAIDDMTMEYRLHADLIMAKNTFLFPAAPKLLREIKKLGSVCAIVSNKYRFRIEETLEMYGLSDLFSIVLGPEDFSNFKPDPEGLLLAVQRLGVSPSQTLYIGDSIIDAQTAMNAGVDFAAVTTGHTVAEAFLTFPYVKIIPDLSSLLD